MKRKIQPGSAKDKGRRFQQWLCQKISEITGFSWGSSGDDYPIESRPMGQSGPDVRMETAVKRLFPYSVECKWQETWDVPAWVRQAQKNTPEGEDWLLFIRKNNMKNPYALVVMDADTFFRLQNQALNRSE